MVQEAIVTPQQSRKAGSKTVPVPVPGKPDAEIAIFLFITIIDCYLKFSNLLTPLLRGRKGQFGKYKI